LLLFDSFFSDSNFNSLCSCISVNWPAACYCRPARRDYTHQESPSLDRLEITLNYFANVVGGSFLGNILDPIVVII
jgi:hypothetical protein